MIQAYKDLYDDHLKKEVDVDQRGEYRLRDPWS